MSTISQKKTSKRKPISKALRTGVWNRYHKNRDNAQCYVGCGEIITVFNFECGHILAVANGGDTTLDNLRPICSSCNKSMGSQNMNDFIKMNGFHSLLKPHNPTIKGALTDLLHAIVTTHSVANVHVYDIEMYQHIDKLTQIVNNYVHLIKRLHIVDVKYTECVIDNFMLNCCHVKCHIKMKIDAWDAQDSGQLILKSIIKYINHLNDTSVIDVTLIDKIDVLLIKYLRGLICELKKI